MSDLYQEPFCVLKVMIFSWDPYSDPRLNINIIGKRKDVYIVKYCYRLQLTYAFDVSPWINYF